MEKELLAKVMNMPGVGRYVIAKELKCSDQTARTLCMIRDNIGDIENLIINADPELKEVSFKGTKRYLVLGCVHVPFHNKKLMNGIVEMLKVNRFDGIVLAGDFLDMGALSAYDKGKINKLNVTLEDEYFAANQMLDIFDTLLPDDADKYFMYGNHCARYYKWLTDVNNHKIGNLLDPQTGLKLKERNYTIFNDYANDILKLGSLEVIHGEYYNIHCAKKHLDVFRRNILFFHTHRVQMHREGDFCGYNAGGLYDIKSPAFNYAPRGMKKAWGNGFAEVIVTENNHFVNIINCIGDKFTYNNQIYGG